MLRDKKQYENSTHEQNQWRKCLWLNDSALLRTAFSINKVDTASTVIRIDSFRIDYRHNWRRLVFYRDALNQVLLKQIQFHQI